MARRGVLMTISRRGVYRRAIRLRERFGEISPEFAVERERT
jgi:hypothetical protein